MERSNTTYPCRKIIRWWLRLMQLPGPIWPNMGLGRRASVVAAAQAEAPCERVASQRGKHRMGRGSSCDRWFGRRGDAYPSLRKAGRFGAGSSFAALDLERGFLCGVRGVGDGGGSVVLVPDFAVFGFMDFRRGAFSPEETDGLFPVSAVRAPSLRPRKFSSVPVPSTSGDAE